MSSVLAVQTKKYGAITVFDLLHERRLVASLIKEGPFLVDYSRRRIFQDLDSAIEFYLIQITLPRGQGLLMVGSLSTENAFVVHDSCSSFPLP
jgi:hypothetical protein